MYSGFGVGRKWRIADLRIGRKIHHPRRHFRESHCFEKALTRMTQFFNLALADKHQHSIRQLHWPNESKRPRRTPFRQIMRL